MFHSRERQLQEELKSTKEKLRSTKDKLKSTEEELRSFKKRMAEGLSLPLNTGDTENMNNPVNKTRLQEMYSDLRVFQLPEVTKQLQRVDKGSDPQKLHKLIKDAFHEAASMTSLWEFKKKMLRGEMSNRELPQKVNEYMIESMQSLQRAFYYCNKTDLPCSAVTEAPEVSKAFVTECYWLGCLMALNNPPLQPNWTNHQQGLDRWNILPHDMTPITQKPNSERKMENPDPIESHRSPSMRSDKSIDSPLNFRRDLKHYKTAPSKIHPQTRRKKEEHQELLNSPIAEFQSEEKNIVMFVKEQLQMFATFLALDQPQITLEYPERTLESEEEQVCREAVLKMTLNFLKMKKLEPLANILQKKIAVPVCCRKLKTQLHQRFSNVCEGVAKPGNSISLQQIYTELNITEGRTLEVNQEHEVRRIESVSRRPEERVITCQEIFMQHFESKKSVRTVVTLGVAGVGKTVLTQKFILDWAEGRANQDIDLLFPFTFRDLNVLRDTQFSLVGLLHRFFSQIKGLSSLEHLKVLFIFDGLDECRLPLDFTKTKVLTEPTESTSVEELLVNLIRGDLFPKARLWITTRPAAANQIPDNCVCVVTEVRGFSDLQKDEYFKKKISVEQQATAVISHIKSTRSLYIMSSIPIFCWILSTVLLHLMKNEATEQLPHTLTQMYVHFLVVQAKVKNIKYHEGTREDPHWTPDNIEMVWSLGKLAFEQLLKGNMIFYESDLRECGLDAAKVAQSGVFTEVFREESGLYQDKVYSFIHLSVQEFLAALHVHQTFFSSRKNLLSPSHSSESPESFYCSAVDQALQSPNGHLDLFLRFLLGLSLPDNQRQLKGLLTYIGSSSETNERTVEYIKDKLNEDSVSAERSLNLLHCLNELNDCSLVEETQKVIKRGHVYKKTMSRAQRFALSFLLLSSDSDLEEFDLRKYGSSEEALKSLMPVVKASNKAILSCCNLSERSCAPLASVLSSSSLTHLDLSNNDLGDSGVKQLCEGLKSAPCKLETLGLSGCLISQSGGAALAAALSSGLCHLTELDLSYNHPGPSADLLTQQWVYHGDQHSLRLEPTGQKWLTPGLKKYFCELSLDPNTANKRLKLSNNNRTVNFMKEEQLYPDHQHRFDSTPQVLCSNALIGHAYWEVILDMDLENNESVAIAMSYFGITSKRDGKNCEFGANNESWALDISEDSYRVRHDGKETKLLNTPPFHQIMDSSHTAPFYRTQVAVYLDYTGRSLSFYEINDSRKTLLYTYHSSFTQPLFAGFRVNRGSVSVVHND